MNIITQLERDEGRVPYVYKDSLGYHTIGVGFLVDKRKHAGLDDAEIDFILKHRTELIHNKMLRRWPWMAAIGAARRGAFTNMAYQMGVDGLAKFQNTLIAAERDDWETCAREALDSTWARQTPARAKRIAQQLETGEWV